MSDVKPALLAIIRREWLDQAWEELGSGEKQQIRFGTNSSCAAPALNPPLGVGDSIRYVYFKVKGNTNVIARAAFISAERKENLSKRIRGAENKSWKYYYEFRGLEGLGPIPLSKLRHRNGYPVRNDIAGSCVILDPLDT